MCWFCRHLGRATCEESTPNIINDDFVTVGVLKSLDRALSVTIFTNVISFEEPDDNRDINAVVQGSCKKLLAP